MNEVRASQSTLPALQAGSLRFMVGEAQGYLMNQGRSDQPLLIPSLQSNLTWEGQVWAEGLLPAAQGALCQLWVS